jgi:hypothetical protein
MLAKDATEYLDVAAPLSGEPCALITSLYERVVVDPDGNWIEITA